MKFLIIFVVIIGKEMVFAFINVPSEFDTERRNDPIYFIDIYIYLGPYKIIGL